MSPEPGIQYRPTSNGDARAQMNSRDGRAQINSRDGIMSIQPPSSGFTPGSSDIAVNIVFRNNSGACGEGNLDESKLAVADSGMNRAEPVESPEQIESEGHLQHGTLLAEKRLDAESPDGGEGQSADEVKRAAATVESLKERLLQVLGELDKSRKREAQFEAELKGVQEDKKCREALQSDCANFRIKVAKLEKENSELNSHLTNLMSELTLARTVDRPHVHTNESSSEDQAQSAKEGHRIADLVVDIRHLQLDLEFHQQKLEQMITEKQEMLVAFKAAQKEAADSKLKIEELEQMLKHRNADIELLQDELKRCKPGMDMEHGEKLDTLRSEVAVKDSALFAKHYELHVERVARDKVEQQNAKIRDRMQKLVLVVETMRKDNMALEKKWIAADRQSEEKDVQLRKLMLKAQQLKRLTHGSELEQRSSSRQKHRLVALDDFPGMQQKQIDTSVYTPR